MHHSFTTIEPVHVRDATSAMRDGKLLNIRVPIGLNDSEVWIGKVIAIRAEQRGHTITMDF